MKTAGITALLFSEETSPIESVPSDPRPKRVGRTGVIIVDPERVLNVRLLRTAEPRMGIPGYFSKFSRSSRLELTGLSSSPSLRRNRVDGIPVQRKPTSAKSLDDLGHDVLIEFDFARLLRTCCYSAGAPSGQVVPQDTLCTKFELAKIIVVEPLYEIKDGSCRRS